MGGFLGGLGMTGFTAYVVSFAKARVSLWLFLVFTVFLGLMNWLLVNQTALLYLFYLPVITAAMVLRRRDAVGVAALATVMILAYAFYRPGHLMQAVSEPLLWAQLIIWGGILVLTAYTVATLRAKIQEAMANLTQAYRGVLAILSRFIQTVDADTEAHCTRVGAWAVRIGQGMRLDPSTIEELRIAALLHDVGKVDVSVDLLRKAAALSEQERTQVAVHAERGALMVRGIGGMMEHIANAIEAHHEKYDGTGPRKTKGDQIPLAARIVAVADVFDALLSDRPYRKGMAISEALANIVSLAGKQFDPAVAAALKTIVDNEGDLCAAQTVGAAATG
jgi:HD superfamily phosphohydrolase YqeK